MMLIAFGNYVAAWLALLAIPLVAFYFLKLKRPKIRISSLVLWQQVMNDSRVNSPFQRFKRNLLLWLQLLLLLLLVLAAMQPFLHSGAKTRKFLPILIDCSASMGSREGRKAPTRLDEAKKLAAERIQGIARGEKICLIAVGRTARRVKDFSNNRRELLDALDTIEVEEVEGDIEDGLRMARALGRAHTVAEVLLLSDGNIPLNSAMELPFMLTFERIEPKGDNIGITSLRAIRSGSTEWSLFVGIDCSENYRGTATLEAFAGDTQLLSETVAPGIDDPERVVFNVPGDVASRVQLRLSAGVNDSLLSDNVAYLDLPALRAVAVYAAEQLPACRRVFGSMPDLILSPDSTGAENAGSLYDVALDDHFSEDRETSVLFTAGEIPAALTSVVERTETADSVVDWQRSDPIMQHVGLGSVELSASVRYMSSNGVEACEEKDFQVVVHGRHGPILVKREMPTFVYYALLVDFDKTTLPYRIAFPVMLSNLVRLSLKLGGQADVRAVKTGIIDGFIASPSESCTVKLPDGASRKLVADKEGRLPGIIADKAGLYRIGGSVGSEIGASLLSAHETRLGSVEELNFAEVTVKPSDASPAAVRVLWPVIVLIALMVLLLEWWFFNRIRLVVGCNEEGKDVN